MTLLHNPSLEGADKICRGPVVEAPLALLEEQVDVLPRNAVIAAHVAEFGDVESVAGSEGVCVDNTVGLDPLTNDRD